MLSVYSDVQGEKGFVAVFSANYFPNAQIVLEWAREDGGSNVYRWKDKEMEGWLCPALLHYFSEAPATLYIRRSRCPHSRQFRSGGSLLLR